MKKKIFAIALAASIAVLAIAGTSMAYFTDVEEATNVFTAGNVDIKLTYSGSDVDGDDDNSANDVLKVEDKDVYPGQTFARNATITNIGSENAYVGAVITLTNANGNLDEVITPQGDADNIPVAITTLFTKFVTDGYYVTYAEVTNGYAVYVVKTAEMSKDQTEVLFENIVIPTAWDNAQMADFNGTEIKVTAYATQVKGMENGALAALQTAFDAFDNVPAQNP